MNGRSPPRRRRVLAGLAGVAAAGLGAWRGAPASSPARALRIIVPQAAGGAADAMVRLIGEPLARTLGRQILVDNRPGGGTVTGTLALAQASADGDTIGFVVSAHAINQAMRQQMPYDALADFEPVCLAGYSVLALVARPDLPADDVRQLAALAARSRPRLQYASLGTATASHLAGELFNLQAGVQIEHVPFNGSAKIYLALGGDELKLAYTTLDSALPHLRAGSLKLLGVTNARRIPAYPQYPAIAESLPGFEVIGFVGFVAPAGTPARAVERLYAGIASVLRTPAVAQRLAELATVVNIAGPEQFGIFLRQEIAKYSALARRTGIKVE